MRRGLVLCAAAAAVTGVLAGLARSGVLVGWGPAHAFEHGPLMVLGVFGTVIGLERAVALARGWAYSTPVLGAVAATAMLAGLSWAPVAACASTAALTGVNVVLVRKQSASFTWLMLLGAAVLFVGTLAWALGALVYEVAPTWIVFFVLTIAAERLELSRLTRTPLWATRVLLALSIGLALCACLALARIAPALRLLGPLLALIGVWQLRFDVARRTVRQRGLPRFSAMGILLGSGWLVVAGVLLTVHELPAAGPVYDATLHAVFLGYVLSMVFAHAPIILPAVARVDLPYHPSLFAALGLLHLGLAVRIAGDLVLHPSLREIGAIANALAFALFAVAVVYARLTRRRGPVVRS